jgi:MYXO-CTERM domain-containing protein
MPIVCQHVPQPGSLAPRTGRLEPRAFTAPPSVAVAIALCAAALLGPSRARACSCAPESITRSRPADGATFVPTDIAPIIEGHFESDRVALEREDGSAVAFELNTGAALGYDYCAGLVAELIPTNALEPETTYVVRASHGASGSPERTVRFTTGSAPVAGEPLVAPEVTISFVRGNPIGDSCLGHVQGCLTVHGEREAAVTVRRVVGAPILGFVRGTLTFDLLDDGEPECVEVRTRDAAGRRSANATTVCRGDFPIRDAVESDYEGHVLRCAQGAFGKDAENDVAADAGSRDDGDASIDEREARDGSRKRSELDTARADGCSTAAGTTRGAHDAALPLFVLLLLALRRRVRVRARALP